MVSFYKMQFFSKEFGIDEINIRWGWTYNL